MNIRRYTEGDRLKVLSLLEQNTPTYFAVEEKKDLIYYLDNFADNYFLVENNGNIIGSGGYNLTEDLTTGRISWDMVDVSNQLSGVGTLLMNYRLIELKSIATVTQVSVRTSQLVFGFYEKFGLRLQEVIPDYWAKGFDLYRLDCPIDSIQIL